MKNYYDILGITMDASQEEIEKKYIELVKKYHPDINDDPNANQLFQEIQRAYEILSNPSKRIEYNKNGDSEIIITSKQIDEFKWNLVNNDLYLFFANEYWWFINCYWNSELNEKNWIESLEKDCIIILYNKYKRNFSIDYNFFKKLYFALRNQLPFETLKNKNDFIIDYNDLNLETRRYKPNFVKWNDFWSDYSSELTFNIDSYELRNQIRNIYDLHKKKIVIKKKLENIAWEYFKNFKKKYPETDSFNYFKLFFSTIVEWALDEEDIDEEYNKNNSNKTNDYIPKRPIHNRYIRRWEMIMAFFKWFLGICVTTGICVAIYYIFIK